MSLLQRVGSREAGDIPKLLALPRAKLMEALRGTPAGVLIDPGAHEQGAGTRAVKALAEAGVRARTVASLTENPLPGTRDREIWIIDESSLLGTRQSTGFCIKLATRAWHGSFSSVISASSVCWW